ncbi:MAG TPA: OsmC family protein [bacterium]|nr:OsmC family protein [bacterium]
MAEHNMVDTVRTRSIGVPGRALNSARTHHFVLDSSSGPSEALTNSEAFLAGISSCGVTLIEKYAKEAGMPLTGMEITITGTRAANPARFQAIAMRFEIHGVDKAAADRLVEVWQTR